MIGDGYCRSEGVVAVFLQKQNVSRRIYCTILHARSNNDGRKEKGKINYNFITTNITVDILLSL